MVGMQHLVRRPHSVPVSPSVSTLAPTRRPSRPPFSGLQAVIDGTSAAPIATRVFSFSLPLSCAERGQEIPFLSPALSYPRRRQPLI
jgi:hypothetical protein